MKNLIIYAASAMFALTACNALDIIPSDSYSDPVVWQDQNLIKMYVNDQYNALVGQDNFYRYSFFSVEVYQKYNDEGCNYIRENILTSDNVGSVSDVLNYWNTGYGYLHKVNMFFENIESSRVDEEFKNTMKTITLLLIVLMIILTGCHGGKRKKEIYPVNAAALQ